jgi:hypothetical protein
MTTVGRRRIDRIQGSLTPRQAVLLWLDEASQFGTMRGYVHSLQGQPTSVFPLFRLPEQVEGSVRAAMKGQPREQLEQGVRAGIRDVAFLYYLVIQVNGRELAERRANCLQLMLMVERLRSFLSDEALVGERHRQWLEFVESLASRLYAFDAAVQRIGQQYLDGRRPLFPDSAESLQSLIDQLEGMIELYNDRLGDEEPRRRGKASKPVDVRRLRASASRETTALVHELVTEAKAEALLMMDEAPALS